jgi:hypothetical protein
MLLNEQLYMEWIQNTWHLFLIITTQPIYIVTGRPQTVII